LGGLTKSQTSTSIGPPEALKENVVIRTVRGYQDREWYYIISMYKYYQLTLFLILIG